jgi:isopropylmalate/homocitrate/citramalate synthase
MKRVSGSTPWKTDKWFTSPWNWAAQVRQDFRFADEIELYDVSLRDGEQQAGLIFDRDLKLALAEKLAEVGVHRIEAGMPVVSPQDAEVIKILAARNDFPARIFSFARCLKEDVKRSVDLGVKNICMEVPISDHLIENAYRWSVERAVEHSIEATLYAHDNGLYVSFFTIDSTRADIDDYLDLIEKVATHGHMDELTVVDTFGGLHVQAVPYLIRKVKERIKDKPIGVHFHDDYGLGAATTLAALAAGVNIAHTTISGIGERAGNAAYEDVALGLLTLYGIDLGLRYDRIYPLSKFLREKSGLTVRQNQGIVGDDLADIESGIVADWYRNAMEKAPLELSPYRYSLTGHPDTRVVIGKMSGIATVDIYLEQLGLNSSLEQRQEIVIRVKEKAYEKMGLLTLGEFENIARSVIGE